MMLSKDVAYLRKVLLQNNFSGFEQNRADAMAADQKFRMILTPGTQFEVIL